MADPVVVVHFGRQHEGKTYIMEQFANIAPRKTVFVYNAGKKSDWKGYEVITLHTKKDKSLWFEYKGKEYAFKQHFMRLFNGKKVRTRRGRDVNVRKALFWEMTQDGYEGLFLILDDAMSLIGQKLTFEMNALFFGSKHVDVWLGVVFHSIRKFPLEAWETLTFARFFKSNVSPPKNKEEDIPHFRKILAIHAALQKAPRRSYCSLDFITGEVEAIPYKAN